MAFIASPHQQEQLREGGKILAAILRDLAAAATPGTTTRELEDLARQRMAEHGVRPSFLGYGGYPAALCTSVNDEAVHAVPSARMLAVGDLVKIDCGVEFEGLHTDSAVTVLVTDGAKHPEFAERATLLRVTREALYAGIAQARAGNTARDIGRAVQEVVERAGFAIVKELGGHGVGEQVHQEPFIANYDDPEYAAELRAGMVLAIEPITSTGGWKVVDGADGHVLVMRDHSLSAHFEHTIIVTDGTPTIVTD